MNLTLKNSSVKELLDFKTQTKESIDRIKAKDSLTDGRLNRLEDSLNETNRYLSGFGQKGSIDKDELIKLLASKAERDMDER